MREIIFRGKHKYSNGRIGEWWYGSLSVTNDGHAFIIDHNEDCIVEVEPSTVGQYAGLEDCTNAMLIYEGDVLDWTDVKGTTGRGVVKFKDGRFVVEFIDGSMSMSLCCFNDEAKVIGNIHDGVKE